MRINHNIQALNSYRNLSKNSSSLSKNLEKLSSGLRINRAADDAAGLAISEKMRSQIRGLDMAERNTLDGISLLQTAEGALGTTHEILQRMRELAVQAANGTLEDQDRQAIQSEIDQLTQEIDRIAKTTQFNAKPLLRGSLEGRAFTTISGSELQYMGNGTWSGTVTAAPTSPAQVELNFDKTFGLQNAAAVDGKTFTINGKTYQINSVTPSTGVFAANGNINVNVSGWNSGGSDVNAVNNINAVMDALADAINKNDPMFAASAKTDATAPGSTFATNGQLVLSTNEKMSPAQAKAISVVTTNTGVAFYEPGKVTPVTSLIAKEDALVSRSISLSFTEVPKAGDTISIDGTTIEFVDTTPASPNQINITDKTIYDVLGELDQQLQTLRAGGGIPALTSHSVVGNSLILTTSKTNDGLSNGLEVRIQDQDFAANAGMELKVNMQIGANAEETMDVSIGVMDTAKLGLARQADHTTVITTPGVDAAAGIDVSSSQEAARTAIEAIDRAVKMVSQERSRMGAYQNRMEHTISNLGIASENLTSAESRIRDADMAKEMSEYTKNNIINQAATAMLAQANQLPQGILQLLK